MRRLRLLLLLFVLALTLPLGYVVMRTYQGLEHEESAKLRFFGETLFDAMQEELADLIRHEESRSVEAYNTLQNQLPEQPYILAYVQAAPEDLTASQTVTLVAKDPASSYVVRKNTRPKPKKRSAPKINARHDLKLEWLDEQQIVDKNKAQEEARSKEGKSASSRFSIIDDLFAGKYFSLKRKPRQQEYLVKQESRVEQLTAEQAKQLALQEQEDAQRAAAAAKSKQKPAARSAAQAPAGQGADAVLETDIAPDPARPETGARTRDLCRGGQSAPGVVFEKTATSSFFAGSSSTARFSGRGSSWTSGTFSNTWPGAIF